MDVSELYTNDRNKSVLEDDPPINGQNWVCLSFVSPESVLKDKDAFTVAKFLQSHASARGEDFEKLYEDFVNFKYKHSDKIDEDYSKEHKNVNHIRGIKVRGVYSTQEEAKLRAENIHKIDKNFHVFVGTVGQWLPWDPCGDKIEDEVFLDEGLNQLISEYKSQSNKSNEVFSERMSEVRKEKDSKTDYEPAISINQSNLNIMDEDEEDPWIKSKLEEPVVEDPVVEDPVVEDPVVEDPVIEEVVNCSSASSTVEEVVNCSSTSSTVEEVVNFSGASSTV